MVDSVNLGDAEKPKQSDDIIIKELAALSPMDYDKQREVKAKELGVRVGTLDKEVATARGESDTDTKGQGRKVELYQPEPWPEPINGDECLDEARAAIMKYMVMPDEYATATTLWAAHTHIYDCFNHSPRLAVTAPDAECGKTLLMHLAGALATRPQPVEIMKAAPFFRLAETHKPTFLIDETDVFIKEDSDLLAAINNGWEPHGTVPRCVGEDNEVRLFSTFTPVAMGGIKLHKVLPATTLSRSVVIELQRAQREELKPPFDNKANIGEFLQIGRKLARWTHDNRARIANAKPSLPAGVYNRRADKWGALFAIAETAGGDWPSLAKKALLLEDKTGETKLSTALQLLADIREVMFPHEEKIATQEMINRLCKLDESPWADYNFRERETERRAIQSRQISNLLKDYKVAPGDIRIGGWNGKGYKQTDILTASNRYLRPILSVTPRQTSNGAAFSDSLSATTSNSVADSKALKPCTSAGCHPVTDIFTPDTADKVDRAVKNDLTIILDEGEI